MGSGLTGKSSFIIKRGKDSNTFKKEGGKELKTSTVTGKKGEIASLKSGRISKRKKRKSFRRKKEEKGAST